jgi:hypothetical protein
MNFIIKATQDGHWDVKKTQTVIKNHKKKRVLKTVRTFTDKSEAVEFAEKQFAKYHHGVIGIYSEDSKLPRVMTSKPRSRENYRTIKEVNYGSSIDPVLLRSAIVEVMIAS